jgi:hypothetical protein
MEPKDFPVAAPRMQIRIQEKRASEEAQTQEESTGNGAGPTEEGDVTIRSSVAPARTRTDGT